MKYLYFLVICTILLNCQLHSQANAKKIFYKNYDGTDSVNTFIGMWNMIKDSIPYYEKDLTEDEKKSRKEVKHFLKKTEKAEKSSKKDLKKSAFNFFAFRQEDTVFIYNKQPGIKTYGVNKWELNSLRKHRIDSIYYEGKLTVDTGSYVLNLDSSPGWVIKYDISFKDTVENILGFNCVNIEIIETKIPPASFTNLPEVNQFIIYATKEINPAITLQPLLFLQRKILEEYTPLQVAKYRDGRRLAFYKAVKIEK